MVSGLHFANVGTEYYGSFTVLSKTVVRWFAPDVLWLIEAFSSHDCGNHTVLDNLR